MAEASARPADRRWPWVVSGVLLVVAGAAAWRATLVSWSSCAGATSLASSILASYLEAIEWSDACYVQMDGGGFLHWPDPGAADAAATSMVVTAAAWLVLVAGVRWSLLARLLAAGAGSVTLVLGVVTWTADRAGSEALRGDLMLAVDVTALAAFAAVVVTWRCDHYAFGRAAVAWLAAASFGAGHMLLEYLAMVTVSAANWDTPPGTGYLSAWFLAASGVAIIVLTLLRSGSAAPAPQQVEQVDAVA